MNQNYWDNFLSQDLVHALNCTQCTNTNNFHNGLSDFPLLAAEISLAAGGHVFFFFFL